MKSAKVIFTVVFLSLLTTGIFYVSYNFLISSFVAGFFLAFLKPETKQSYFWLELKKILLYSLISAVMIDLLLLILDFDEGIHLFTVSFFLNLGVLFVLSLIGLILGLLVKNSFSRNS